MQNDFIEFMDIKLQSAEQTRLKVKEHINFLYNKFLECEDLELLRIREKFLVEAIWTAFGFGLIDYSVRDGLLRNIDILYMSRCDELRKEKE